MNIPPNQLLPACRRRNHVLAAYVNAAVAVRTSVGLKRAEEFAHDAGVPAHVLLRVLLAGGPFRPHARFLELPSRHGPPHDTSAGSSAYFRTQDASSAHAFGVNKRVDQRMALLVDAAINAAASHGVAGAAAELIDFGVPVDLVFRVLCQPGARRPQIVPPPAESPMPAGPALACRRRNHVHAAYVNAALTVSALISVQRAEAMLVEQGVADRVIARILHLNGFGRGQGKALPAASAFRPATACSPPRAPS